MSLLDSGTRLFGTDGIRGPSPEVLTPEFATALARAAGEGREGSVFIGRDTRRSGDLLAAALTAGFAVAGLDVHDLGILPTAGVAQLARGARATFGVVVSASHNPASDNGIKFFGGDGAKLSDKLEDEIEARLRSGPPWAKPPAGPGIRVVDATARARYVSWLVEQARFSHRGFEIAVDCANGAAFQAAPELFTSLGADVLVTCDTPDGTNINDGCGATNPNALAAVANGRVGLCFDGDADRLIAIDEDGIVANGDIVMAVIAGHLKQEGRLKDDKIVGTVMANLGFMKAMEREGIEVIATAVGDRYVAEAMKEHGAVLGGEQSGHVIFSNISRTGDGLLTAIQLLDVMAATGKPLTELRLIMNEYPQVLRNVHVEDKEGLDMAVALWEGVDEAERELGDSGRILVRPSGTEPMVRVMVEAPEAHQAATIADRLAELVRLELS